MGSMHYIHWKLEVPSNMPQIPGNGNVVELTVAGNGHCYFLSLSELLRLKRFTPLDLRLALGAWMVSNEEISLPGCGGVSLREYIADSYHNTVKEYAQRLIDPYFEEHEECAGRRTFVQGTEVELICSAL